MSASSLHPELVPYHLHCDRPPLTAELGPPDYYPLVPGGCPEDTIDASTLATGYKWVPESLRITEANEPLLSLTCHNAAYWDKHNAQALRQCVHSRLAAVHRQRLEQKKAELKYDVPIGRAAAEECFTTAPALQSVSDQEAAGWLLDLAGTVDLAQLASRVPNNIQRDGLFQLLVERHIPLPRALWLIQLTYWQKPPPATASAANASQQGPAAAVAGALSSPRTTILPGDSSSRAQQARAQHWTLEVLQTLEKYVAAAAVANGAAVTARAAAATAAAAAASSSAAEVIVILSPPGQATAAAATDAATSQQQQQQRLSSSMSDPAGDGSSSIPASRRASATGSAASTAAAEAAAARAATAETAASAAAAMLQAAVRLACYSIDSGLVAVDQVVTWVEQQLGGGVAAAAAAGSSAELQEVALAVTTACLKKLGSCHSLVLRVARSLLHHIDTTSAAATVANPAAVAGDAPEVHQQQQQSQTAQQLLQQLFLLAPAAFIALDSLPQLSKVLLGPAAAQKILYCTSSSSWQQQQQQQQGERSQCAAVAGCLSDVLQTARQMAAGVSPRLLSFSLSVAYSQLSSCCLCGDVHGALAALMPAVKGFLPADHEEGYNIVINLVLDWACSSSTSSSSLPWHLLPSGPQHHVSSAAAAAQPQAGPDRQAGSYQAASSCTAVQAAPNAVCRRLFACRVLLKLRDKYNHRLHTDARQQQQQQQEQHTRPATGSAAQAKQNKVHAQQQQQQHAKGSKAANSHAGDQAGTGPVAVAGVAVGGSSLSLQPFITSWIAGEAHSSSSSSSRDSSRSGTSNGVDFGHSSQDSAAVAAAAALVIQLISFGLFDPHLYLQQLVAQSLLLPGSSSSSGDRTAVKLHTRMLRHLHPKLPWFDTAVNSSSSSSRSSSGVGAQQQQRGKPAAADDGPTNAVAAASHGSSKSKAGSSGRCSLPSALLDYWAADWRRPGTRSSQLKPLEGAVLLQQQHTGSSCSTRRSKWSAAHKQYASGRRVMIAAVSAAAAAESQQQQQQQQTSDQQQPTEQQLPPGFEPWPAAKRQKREQPAAAVTAVPPLAVNNTPAAPATSAASYQVQQRQGLHEVQQTVMAWLGLAGVDNAAASSSKRSRQPTAAAANAAESMDCDSCWDDLFVFQQQQQQQPGISNANATAAATAEHTATPTAAAASDSSSAAVDVEAAVAALRPYNKAALVQRLLAAVAAVVPLSSHHSSGKTGRAHDLPAQQEPVSTVAAAAAAMLSGPAAALWLQRLVSVLAAADGATEAAVLLLQLLDRKIKVVVAESTRAVRQQQQQQRRSSDDSQTMPPPTAAAAAADPAAAVPGSSMLALLEGLQDVIAAAGLLPVLLEVCVGWAAPPITAAATANAAAAGQQQNAKAGKGPQGNQQQGQQQQRQRHMKVSLHARSQLGVYVTAAGRFLSCYFTSPCVKTWWEGYQNRAAALQDNSGAAGAAAAGSTVAAAGSSKHWIIVQLTTAVGHYRAAVAAGPNRAGSGAAGTSSSSDSDRCGLLGSGVIRAAGILQLPGAHAATAALAAASAAVGAAARDNTSWRTQYNRLMQTVADSSEDCQAQQQQQQQLMQQCKDVALQIAHELAQSQRSAVLHVLQKQICCSLLQDTATAATQAAGNDSSSDAVANCCTPQGMIMSCFNCVLQQLLLLLARSGSSGSSSFGCGVEWAVASSVVAAAKQLLQDSLPQQQQQQWVLQCVLTAAASGIVLLPDVLQELLLPHQAGQQISDLSVGVYDQVLAAALGCCQQHQHQQQQLLDPGQCSTLGRLQSVLPVDAVLSVLQEPLLTSVLSGMQLSRNSSSSRDAVVSVLANPWIRSCIMTDPKVLYSSLADSNVSILLKSLASADRSAFWALPQRLAVQSIMTGVLHVMTPTGVVLLPHAAAEETQHTTAAAVNGMAALDGQRPKEVVISPPVAPETPGLDTAAAAVAPTAAAVPGAVAPTAAASNDSKPSTQQSNSSRPSSSITNSKQGLSAPLSSWMTYKGLAAAAAAVGPDTNPAAVPYILAQIEFLSGLNSESQSLHCLLNPDLAWLMLRLLIDEQMVMEYIEAECNKASSAAGSSGEDGSSWLASLEAAAAMISSNSSAAGRAATNMTVAVAANALVMHTEKNLVDVLLVAAARCPAAAVAAAEVVCGVATAAGEYLLKRVDWLLQDRGGSWLAGATTLSQMISKLEPAQLLAAAEATTVQNVMETQPLVAADPALIGSHSTAPFAIEAALSDVVLLLLSKSTYSRQREFAAELVRQICRLVEILKRSPPPSAAAVGESKAAAAATSEADKPSGAAAAAEEEAAAGEQRRTSDMDIDVEQPAAPTAAADAGGLTPAGMTPPYPPPPPVAAAATTKAGPTPASSAAYPGPPGSSNTLGSIGNGPAQHTAAVGLAPGSQQPAVGAAAAGGYGHYPPPPPPPPGRPRTPPPPPGRPRTPPPAAAAVASSTHITAAAAADASIDAAQAGTVAAAGGGGLKHRRFGAALRMAAAATPGSTATETGGTADTAAAAAQAAAGSSDRALAPPARTSGGGSAADRSAAAAAANPSAAGSRISSGAASTAVDIGSPGGVQLSVWLRLRLLLPLLPTVRADREGDSRKNLRVCLSQALPQLLLSPYVMGDAEAAGTDPLAAAAAAATTEAGQPLFDRLLLVLSALLSGEWAGWLRGTNKKLKEVPALTSLAAACRTEVETALQASQGAWGTNTQGLGLAQAVPLVSASALSSLFALDADYTTVEPDHKVELKSQPGADALRLAAAVETPEAAAEAVMCGQQCSKVALLDVEQVVQALWQQQQQWQQQCDEGCEQKQRVPMQRLSGSRKGRILAALPQPGQHLVQVPTISSAQTSQEQQGQASQRAAKQQQHVESHSWDVWLPVCPSQRPTAGPKAAAPPPPPASAGNRRRSPVPPPFGRVAGGQAAVSLLGGCVRRRQQGLLYAASDGLDCE